MSHDQQEFTRRIRELGYRLTPQRQLILDTLCKIGRHATAAEVCRHVHEVAPAVNRATVYRTLNFLCDLRFLVSGEIAGETVYELAEPVPHHHLVCDRCGKVESLANHHFADLAKHLRTEHGFDLDIEHLTLSGLCAACARQENVDACETG